MRWLMIPGVAFVLTCSAVARADTCTIETAVRALGSLAGKAPEARAESLSKALDACDNKFQLLQSVVDKGQRVTERKPAVIGRPANVAGKPAPAGSAGAPPVKFDSEDLSAILRALAMHLSRHMERLEADCRGFKGCPTARLRAFVRNLEWYLGKLNDPLAPAESVREAGALLSTLGGSSPDFALAQAIIQSLARMSAADQGRLAGRHASIRDVLAARTVAEKLRILLENPDQLKRVDEMIAAIGPSRVVVAGRSVNVALGFGNLRDLPECRSALRTSLEAAMLEERPLGVKIYDDALAEFGTILPRHVRLAVSVGRSGAECGADGADGCLAIDVDGWLNTAALGKEVPPERIGRVVAPLKGCALAEGTMASLARDVFRTFSVALRAEEASLDTAQLVRPGCAAVTTEKANPQKWGDPVTRAALRRTPLTIAAPQTSGDWPGFQQELVAALQQHPNVFPGVLAGPRARGSSPSGTMMLSWVASDPRPRTVVLAVRGNGLASGLEATLRFELRDAPECASSLAMMQTIAQRTAAWLANEYVAGPDEPASSWVPVASGPSESGKNWGRASLGLLFAGLPQLIDDDPRNDTRGVILAVADAALLTSTVVLALVSVEQRQQFSSGDEGSLATANDYLLASRVTLMGLAVPRVVSVVW